MGSTLVFCVLFQNNIATQVYQAVVTAYSEEAVQAGMEYFAESSSGLYSWTRLLWKDTWKRPMPRGLSVQIWKRGCYKKLRDISPSLPMMSESASNFRSFICYENAGVF